MKIYAYKEQLGETPESWLRHAGYGMISDRRSGQLSFARRFTRDFYPRFHLYFQEALDAAGRPIIIFNLHLDQKRPGYEGFSRHNAEYDGEVVEREAARISSLLRPDIFNR